MILPPTHVAIGAESRPINSLLGRIASPRTGLLAKLTSLPASAGDVNVNHLSSSEARYSRMPGGGDIDSTGGSYYDLEGAVTRSTFETLERYCGAFTDVNNLLFAQAGDNPAFLCGDELPIFAEEQYAQPHFPFRRLTRDSKIYWAEGRSLVTGKLRYVPASFASIPFYPMVDEEVLGASVSVGLAAGDTWTKACLRGLLEVVEREAFMIMWMNRLSMPRLQVLPNSAFGRELEPLLRQTEARLTFVNMSNDLRIPTVLAVLERRLFGRPLITMGAASKTTLVEAARKAALEAFGCYNRVRQEFELPEPWSCAPDYSNVEDYVHHCLVYADPALHHGLEFITSSEIEQPLADDPSARSISEAVWLRAYCARLAQAGTDVIACSMTTRDVAPLGVHVAKVVVPQAVPLHPNHKYPPLGHRRMYAVPKQLGYVATENRPDQLNLELPHPFP